MDSPFKTKDYFQMTDAAYEEIETLKYRTIKLELGEFKRRGKDGERVIKASLSSEEPVDIGGIKEILLHGKKNVDLRRAQDGLPLLFSHDAMLLRRWRTMMLDRLS
jgi:hypothetical protein